MISRKLKKYLDILSLLMYHANCKSSYLKLRGKEVNTMFKLNQEQFDLMAKVLVSFVCRVAEDKNASPAEISVLPEIVKVLNGMATRL